LVLAYASQEVNLLDYSYEVTIINWLS
jgi:hypothetical protein